MNSLVVQPLVNQAVYERVFTPAAGKRAAQLRQYWKKAARMNGSSGTESGTNQVSEELLSFLGSEYVAASLLRLEHRTYGDKNGLQERLSKKPTSKPHNVSAASEFVEHISRIGGWLPRVSDPSLVALTSFLMLASSAAAKSGVMSNEAHEWIEKFNKAVDVDVDLQAGRSRNSAAGASLLKKWSAPAALWFALFTQTLADAISLKLTHQRSAAVAGALAALLSSAGFLRSVDTVAARTLALRHAIEFSTAGGDYMASDVLTVFMLAALDPTNQLSIAVAVAPNPINNLILSAPPSSPLRPKVSAPVAPKKTLIGVDSDAMTRWIEQYSPQPTSPLLPPARQVAVAAAAPSATVASAAKPKAKAVTVPAAGGTAQGSPKKTKKSKEKSGGGGSATEKWLENERLAIEKARRLTGTQKPTAGAAAQTLASAAAPTPEPQTPQRPFVRQEVFAGHSDDESS